MTVRSRGPALYLLACVLYLALNALVMTATSMTFIDIVLFALANTLPPALLGLLVIRHYARRGSGMRLVDLFCGLAFAVLCVALRMSLSRLVLGRWGARADAMAWAMLIAALLFVILVTGAHLHRTQTQLARAEELRVKAELAALRSKIDPHFLFNTLHTLVSLIHDDPSRAEEAIEQFAATLRYTFSATEGDERRTLEQEWTLVQNYLALEKLRLGPRLRLSGTIDREVAAVPLPVLTLQPIVENAIRHAVAPRAIGGSVNIHAERHGQRVHIRIADDGPGADTAVVEGSAGQGLRLVRERLKGFYGDAASLQVSSGSSGLTVSIDLPLPPGAGTNDKLTRDGLPRTVPSIS